ncbi:thyrotropin-releasing hormone receptor-like [Lineus longissimus]|uniref:thyrotropin-releasing hormone receptor-like n=1 Tax=Lineus longissimus TaxID=88925 RepID=UPI00315D906A
MANSTADSSALSSDMSEAPAPPWLEVIEFITELLYKWWMVVGVGLGVPGNMMSLLITMKDDNRQISTCIYMAALAIVDTGVLIVSEMMYKLCVSHRLVRGLEGNRLFLSFMWYGADGFAVCSGLFLAEMSVDRAIAVIYPMRAATICTASRAVKITITTGVLELLVHTQTFFVLDVPNPPNGALIRNFPDARWWEKFYNAYLLILGTILPFSTLVVCNTIIIIGVNRAARRRKKMKSDTAEKPGKIRDANLTIMMLMTSCAYLVCSSPKRMRRKEVSSGCERYFQEMLLLCVRGKIK